MCGLERRRSIVEVSKGEGQELDEVLEVPERGSACPPPAWGGELRERCWSCCAWVCTDCCDSPSVLRSGDPAAEAADGSDSDAYSG